jgi:prepilin-type N-terminal cleavage/methylation domain-containing protein
LPKCRYKPAVQGRNAYATRNRTSSVCKALALAGGAAGAPAFHEKGLTLIELILVMALLTVVISVAAPTLSQFFRGRALETEARRFLALTRYGQSRAVSAGMPMILWVHCAEGTYGLREEIKFSPTGVGQLWPSANEPSLGWINEEMPLEYELAKDLRFEVDSSEGVTNNVAIIRFSPDGAIDETSLRYLFIRDKDQVTIPIIQTRNRLKYEIADKTNLWVGAYR